MAAQVAEPIIGCVAHRAQRLGHPEFGGHPPRQVGRLGQVVDGSSGWLAEHKQLGRPAAQHDRHTFGQVPFAHQVLIFLWHLQRVPQRALGRGDDADFVDGVGVG